MNNVISYSDFLGKISQKDKSFLLLYKQGSDQSNCAFHNMENALAGQAEAPVYAADVSSVRDIHTQYGVTSAPSLLVFENGALATVIKGC